MLTQAIFNPWRPATATPPKLSLVAMDAAQQQAIETLDSELRFILEDKGLTPELLAKIAASHVTKVSVFANIESQEDKFREWVREDLGIEPRGVGRVATAQLVDAWETARRRGRAQADADAEAKTQGRPRELLLGQQLELRNTFEKQVGREVLDKHYPAYAIINSKLTEIEEGELKAEPLDELVSHDKEDASPGDLNVDFRSGKITLKKTPLKGSLPRGPEELRELYRLMSNFWLVLRCKLPGRRMFDDLNKETFSDLLDHLLGEDIYGLKVEDESGGTMAQTTWKNLIRYEHELRKQAVKLVNRQGLPLAAALKQASADVELRTKYIVTTLALEGTRSSAKRNYPTMEWPAGSDAARGSTDSYGGGRGAKGKGKGRGKDSAKGKTKKGDRAAAKSNGKGEASRFNKVRRANRLKSTTDGQNPQKVCWAYNRSSGCGGGCNFAHVCVLCLGGHSVEQCPRYNELMR